MINAFLKRFSPIISIFVHFKTIPLSVMDFTVIWPYPYRQLWSSSVFAIMAPIDIDMAILWQSEWSMKNRLKVCKKCRSPMKAVSKMHLFLKRNGQNMSRTKIIALSFVLFLFGLTMWFPKAAFAIGVDFPSRNKSLHKTAQGFYILNF